MAAQSTPTNPAVVESQPGSNKATEDSPLPQPIITTSRLIVRPLHLQDAQSMSTAGNDPLVSKYMTLTFPNPYDLKAANTWINMNLTAPINHFGICERSFPDIIIGGIGLKPGADVYAHTAEVGFWIGREYWGKGYTTEVLEAFTRWSFEKWTKDGQRLRRLWGGVVSGNSGSMRVFQKTGYSVEGVMKAHCEKNGEVMDYHLFGMPKGDWERRVSLGFNNQ
ncbi:acyl-CoA N-acyltransferase [Pyrenochaeta sp. DS3sAY3a]|nr:acyl-CoA N-acyltransferase [Pyrenochaeta sp. DS3sAY3a]